MHDSLHADGRTSHMIRLTKNVKPIGLALDSIVDYDLNSFQLKIKDDFSLESVLGQRQQKHDSFVKLAQFAGNLAQS